MAERVTAWRCIGCGRIEGPRPCIGVCQDRKAEFVDAADYEAAIEKLALARRQVEALAGVVRQLACTTPREGRWAQCYRAMQGRAHALLESLGMSGGTASR